jgi:choline kinase
VDHLIDREEELAILRRLCRKNIGPRMLGTFSNGRFEEFLFAKTLEAPDLRVPETSKQIAKRMRELHDGIELLNSEVEEGPAVFLNWDKWVDRCDKVMIWLDEQVRQGESGTEPKPKARYTKLGLICGVEWPLFRQTYNKYRERLIQEYGGEAGLKKKLVFAHNDTQYGNLMRLQPSGESPLMNPSNQHKQLVVIDFEYARQNTIGYEFADHFSEWCYNYHSDNSWACNHKAYPTQEEQHRFIRSYVMHRPQFNPAASATPMMEAREKTNIADFMLDARAPPGGPAADYEEEEREREKKLEVDIKKLMHETKLWRAACAANWVAWGIVQAPVPDLDDQPSKVGQVVEKIKGAFHSEPKEAEEEEKPDQSEDKTERAEPDAEEEEPEEEPEEDFDYLAYSQDRAGLFWGDCLQMGLIKEEDMPESMKKIIKVVSY